MPGEIALYNRDCLPELMLMKDNQFDLAIVDPMYGLEQDSYRNNQTATKLAKVNDNNNHIWTYPAPNQEYFDQIQRVSKNQIIWGGNYFANLLPPSMGWIVWDKVNGKSTYADFELVWTSFKRGGRLYRFMWNGMCQGSIEDGSKMEGNKKKNEKRIHPCQKPVQLYKWILSKYAQKGDRILDTHVGSGSSIIACMEMDHDIAGYEIDPDVFSSMTKRIADHLEILKTKPLKLL